MEGVRTISVSELLRLSTPLTGTASLQSPATNPQSPTPPPPPLKRHKPLHPDEGRTEPRVSSAPNPGKTRPLTPLKHPTLLIGTVDLPTANSDTCGSKGRCLSFSDGTSRVCCAVLDLDIDIIGRKIHVLSWNFVPFKRGGRGGVLEIIRWNLLESEAESCGNLFSGEKSAASRSCARGLLRSVSPIFAVPSASDRHMNHSNRSMEGEDSIGFLAELASCECGVCEKAAVVGEQPLKEQNQHCFNKQVFVYFRGTTSWHPALSMLVGSVIEVSGLKKKHVFVGGEESYLMSVSTERTMVRECRCPAEVFSVRQVTSPKRCELGMYNGVVTGVYMQGMVVELDDKVWLLLTDPLHVPPHSLRVGALISLKNVHFVRPNFSWVRVLLLGACIQTNINFQSFSPFDAQCLVGSHTQSLLGKFIDSLTFSAKFWVLILISCFKKKFSGVFTDKEILGSRNREGLVQKFASSCLPSCLSQHRQGVFMEFCKHDSCGGRNQPNHAALKLVTPFSNFLNHCKVAWMSINSKVEDESEVYAAKNHVDHLYCEGYSYDRLIRRFIASKDLGVVLIGSLQVSSSSGRLQLFDTTKSIDVVIPDLVPDIYEHSIYKVEDYTLVIEGLPAQLESIGLGVDGSLSCRNIFQHALLQESTGLTVYVHFHLRDSTCLNVLFGLPVAVRRNELRGSSALFHLFLLTHKFPSFHSDGSGVLESSSAFAEALFLPYDLILVGENRDSKLMLSPSSWINAEVECVEDWLSNAGNWLSERLEHSHVLHVTSLASSKDTFGNNETGSCKIPCSLTFTGINFQGFLVPGSLYCAKGNGSLNSVDRQSTGKVLLEFKADALCKYQSLSVGAYYILEYSKEELRCCNEQRKESINYSKVTITSRKPLWSFSFSYGKNQDQNEPPPNQLLAISSARTDGVSSANLSQKEIFFHECPNQMQGNSIAWLQLSDEGTGLLEVGARLNGMIKPLANLEEVCSVSSCIKIMMATSLQPSRTSNTEGRLPEGVIISLCGNVTDVHFFHGKSSGIESFGRESNSHIYKERIRGVCIHVHEDDQMVKVWGTFGKCAYALGIGPGVNATFHRLLITCNSRRCHELNLISSTHIVVNSVKEVVHYHKSSNCFPLQSRLIAPSERLLHRIPLGLIPHLIQCQESNAVQFRCRVVRIFLLVLEKQCHKSDKPESGQLCKKLPVKIPLAGFFLDDGSSSCCCWADADKAETLLGLRDSLFHGFVSGRISKRTAVERNKHTINYELDRILKKHCRVTVKNYGALTHPSCVDFTFSVNSSKLFNSLEENFLKSIIYYACRGPAFNIVGKAMDLNTLGGFGKEFIDSEIAKKLLEKNIWAIEVGPANTLAEAGGLLDVSLDSNYV